MTTGLARGAIAGAAGTTALNAVTYLDMAVRGRPSSSSPQDVVERSADKIGVDIPGRGEEREHRLEGLGPLLGTAVGIVVGATAGGLHRSLARRGRHLPAPIEIGLIGLAAMALSDVPLKLLGVSDPKTWAAKDWLSDTIPHLVYGLVTYAAVHATDE